jgi:predicted RNase H-like nuclease (RuvC/YqgF family)
MTTDPEIERLREELAIEKGWVSQYRDSYCKQVAEIERLQNANQDLVDERDIFKRTLDKRDAEIERLRDQVVRLSTLVDTERGLRDAEVERLRKELEREKEEHDRCTTFHAIAVKERNYERVLALHRDTEIKRLRGLLAEAPCTCQNPPPYDWPHDPNNEECYLNRVRESAGGVR